VPVVPDALLEEAARRFALLADPTRLRLVSALHDAGEISVGQLATRSGIPLASVSQHLNRLAHGGLVARRREGTSVKYRISDPSIEALCDLVCAGLREEEASEGETAS
jgi:ArsR family transcriptional regulator